MQYLIHSFKLDLSFLFEKLLFFPSKMEEPHHILITMQFISDDVTKFYLKPLMLKA